MSNESQKQGSRKTRHRSRASATGTSGTNTDDPNDGNLNPLQRLFDLDAFHGLIHMDDAKKLLTTQGDYLVRVEDSAKGWKVLVSVYWDGKDQHFAVAADERGVTVDGKHFRPTIAALVEYHQKLSVPLKGVRLRHPILRQNWELRDSDLRLSRKLGEGAFGEVWSGKLRLSNGLRQKVAVKQAKRGLPKETIDGFMKEARIMRGYRHRNIVCFKGIVAETRLLIVMEYVKGGALDSYLKRNIGLISSEWKATMCFDAASGLQYLHQKECVHRDIAARNCLIDEAQRLVKISDFGLSGIGAQFLDCKKAAPIRWLAPEVLSSLFHDKPADVWAFGVLCWEIYADGELPYKDFTLAQVREHVQKDENFRLNLPPICQPDVSELVYRCWQADYYARPTIDDVATGLSAYADEGRFAKQDYGEPAGLQNAGHGQAAAAAPTHLNQPSAKEHAKASASHRAKQAKPSKPRASARQIKPGHSPTMLNQRAQKDVSSKKSKKGDRSNRKLKAK